MPAGMVAVTMALQPAARVGRAAGFTDHVRALCGRAPIDFSAFIRNTAAVWRPAT
jgi:hypothetical protein